MVNVYCSTEESVISTGCINIVVMAVHGHLVMVGVLLHFFPTLSRGALNFILLVQQDVLESYTVFVFYPEEMQ